MFLKAVSLWIFEKKELDSWQKRDREIFLEVLKKGVLQLTKLRHPRILVVEHPLEESRSEVYNTILDLFLFIPISRL